MTRYEMARDSLTDVGEQLRRMQVVRNHAWGLALAIIGDPGCSAEAQQSAQALLDTIAEAD